MSQLYTQDAVSPLMIQPGEVRVRRHREATWLRTALAALVPSLRLTVRVPVSE